MEDQLVLKMLHSLALLEANILQVTFSQHGSIFFADSVDDELRERNLYTELPAEPLRIFLARKFRIGPSVDRNGGMMRLGEVLCSRGSCMWDALFLEYLLIKQIRTRFLSHDLKRS